MGSSAASCPAPHVVLETERLRLRRFTGADADRLHALDADPAVMRYLTNGRPTHRETVERETLPAILREYARWPGFGRWAAEARAGGEFLGWLALLPTGRVSGGEGADEGTRAGGPPEEAELGYRLRRAAWGRGYATEGARALLRRAFLELGVRRVTAQTMAVNVASRRVMERAGMALVRTFHLQWEDPIPGTEHGEVEYAVLAADWLRRQGGG